jgi:hypothetical protein
VGTWIVFLFLSVSILLFLLARARTSLAAFLVGVECLSQKLACVPCKDKSSGSWEGAITKMVELSMGEIRCLVSDRDAAVTSLKFRESLLRKYGVSWIFLRSRSKAFRAESMIAYMKRRLSMALKGSGGRDWVRYIEGIVQDYNARPVTGTNIVRKRVNKVNYVDLLAQLYKSPDPTMLFNTTSGSNYTEETKRVLFAYSPGQKVLLNKKADYTVTKRTFAKTSVEGAYGERVYVVKSQILKTNYYIHVPVYRLEGLKGAYYESELLPVSFQ